MRQIAQERPAAGEPRHHDRRNRGCHPREPGHEERKSLRDIATSVVNPWEETGNFDSGKTGALRPAQLQTLRARPRARGTWSELKLARSGPSRREWSKGMAVDREERGYHLNPERVGYRNDEGHVRGDNCRSGSGRPRFTLRWKMVQKSRYEPESRLSWKRGEVLLETEKLAELRMKIPHRSDPKRRVMESRKGQLIRWLPQKKLHSEAGEDLPDPRDSPKRDRPPIGSALAQVKTKKKKKK